MKKLSIARAWEETVALVRQESGLLLLISFGLIALPAIILQSATPQVQPGETPSPGLWSLLFVPTVILSILGSLTITVLAIGAERNAGEAFSRALRRFLVVLGAALLLGIGVALIALPLVLVMSLLIQSEASLTFLVGMVVGLAFIFVWVRMMLMTPVAAAESGGPVAVLKRSWSMTRGHVLRLVGFIILVGIVALVIVFAVGAVGGSLIILLAGQPQDGNLSSVLLALLSGVIQAVIGMLLTVMVARIYVQLTDEPTNGI